MSDAVNNLMLVMGESELLNQIAFCHQVSKTEKESYIADRARLEKNVLLDYVTGLCRQGVLGEGFYVCHQGIDACLVIQVTERVSFVHDATEITATKVAP